MATYRDYDDETLNKLHQVELEILDDFIDVCEKNNLTYYLVGGTLLGALRHKGFIPWDDDIDVGLLRKDYDKFIEIGQEALGDKYYLDCFEHNKDCYLPFAKVRMNGTVFDEEWATHINQHKGIFIDIFPIENIKNKKKIGKVRALIIKTIADTTYYRLKMRKFSKLRHKGLSLICMLFPKRFLLKIQHKLLVKNKNHNSEYVNILSGSYAYEKELLKRSDVIPPRKVDFEGRKCNGFNNSELYLTQLYGENYMELPPMEKRRNHKPDTIVFPKEVEKNEDQNRENRKNRRK